MENRCYYFRNSYYHYEDQKQFCKTLFSGNGRLYEPPNLAALTKVYNVGKDTPWYFIGIRDPYQNGTLTYTSNDLPIPFTIPQHPSHSHSKGNTGFGVFKQGVQNLKDFS